MDLSNKLVERNSSIAWRIIEDEALVINPKDGLIYPLNIVGTRIWELLDGKHLCGDIITLINEEFEGDKMRLGEDIFEFIGDLLDKDLACLIEDN